MEYSRNQQKLKLWFHFTFHHFTGDESLKYSRNRWKSKNENFVSYFTISQETKVWNILEIEKKVNLRFHFTCHHFTGNKSPKYSRYESRPSFSDWNFLFTTCLKFQACLFFTFWITLQKFRQHFLCLPIIVPQTSRIRHRGLRMLRSLEWLYTQSGAL